MATRHRRRRRMLGAAIVAIGIAAGGYLSVRATVEDGAPIPGGPATGESPAAAAPAAEAAIVAGMTAHAAHAAPVAVPEIASAALPPRDVPLASVLGELEHRAARGDGRAACRLALDAALCRDSEDHQAAVEFFENSIASQPATSERDVAFIARLQARRDASTRVCRDLPAGWADQHAWRYMLQAAQLGDMRLAARFAVAPPLDRVRFLEQAERWQMYAQYAPQLLLQSAAHGDPRALFYLRRAYAGEPVIEGLPDAIARDPQQALALGLLLRDISDRQTRTDIDASIARLRTQLEADAEAAAERAAEALRARHFTEQPTIDFAAGVFGEQDSRICEQESST